MTREERIQAMARMRDEGQTLAAIGDAFGITRERVRQLLDREAERRGRPFAPRLAPPPACSGCGRTINRDTKSGFCRDCKPRKPWATRTSRVVERGIYRGFNATTGEWVGRFWVQDFRDADAEGGTHRLFDTLDEARAFRAARAAERPYTSPCSSHWAPAQDEVLAFLGEHGQSRLNEIVEGLAPARSKAVARTAVARLHRKGLIERRDVGVYALRNEAPAPALGGAQPAPLPRPERPTAPDGLGQTGRSRR